MNESSRAIDRTNPRVVQILDAASRCFGKKGFAGTTVQEIAAEAGLTKSMIHYYFENKQALIQELQAFVYDRHFQRVGHKLAEAPPEASGRAHEALWEAFEIVRDKQFLRLQLELLAECGRDPAVLKRMAVSQNKLRDLVSKRVLDVLGPHKEKIPAPPEALATLIQAVLHGLRVQELVDGDPAPTREAYTVFVGMMLIALKHFGATPDGA